jgi:transcriptional regulator with XRE-family HTH domain
MTEIEKRRKAKGWSREELAKMVGITYNAVRHYEKRMREPTASILKRMSEVFGCRMEDLI